jgi:ABC-type Fe3+/spermidine/putrescine transport system ATPase subunit
MLLEVENLRHSYGEQEVVRGVSFSVSRGAIGCLLGPSGCGKTTVLRCIAGFESLQEGEIRLAGRVVSGAGVMLAPEKRRIGMVFQDYALFPHLSVAGNIAFGLHAAAADERAARVQELAKLVGLGAALEKFPHEISTRCARSSRRAARRRCWSRTTSRRPSPWPTRSASCTKGASSSGTTLTTSTTARPTASSRISSARACSCRRER